MSNKYYSTLTCTNSHTHNLQYIVYTRIYSRRRTYRCKRARIRHIDCARRGANVHVYVQICTYTCGPFPSMISFYTCFYDMVRPHVDVYKYMQMHVDVHTCTRTRANNTYRCKRTRIRRIDCARRGVNLHVYVQICTYTYNR